MPRIAMPKEQKEGIANAGSVVSKKEITEPEKLAEKSSEKNNVGVDTKETKTENKNPFLIKDGKVLVVSKIRAGKSIIATTGKVVQFDTDGRAEVDIADALYLKNIAGFYFK